MILKLLTITIIGVICGLLGSYAGADNTPKIIRRAGIPFVLTPFACIYLWHLAPLSLVLLFFVLSQGYGIPCHNDEGSKIGKLVYNLIKKYRPALYEIEIQHLASKIVRGIIGKLACLTAISIPIITGNWIVYAICSIVIVSVYAGLSWRGLGSFTFLKKSLTVSEFVTYLSIGLGISLTILF